MQLKRFAFAALLCLTTLRTAATAQAVFVVPTELSGQAAITALAANPLRLTTSITGSPTTFRALAQPDGTFYYLVSRDSLRVLNGNDLSVRETRTLDQARSAAVSPDSKKLLIGTRNQVLIFDTTKFGLTPQASPVVLNIVADDFAFSVDGTRAFAVDTLGNVLNVINLATDQTIGAPAQVSGGIDPASVTVHPGGSVYVSTVNNIYEFDPVTLAERSRTQFRANAGKLVFTPDGAYGFARNQYVINGGSSFLVFDVANKSVNAVPVGQASLVDRVFYAGKNSAGQHVAYAYVRALNRLYEVTLPALTVTPAAITSDLNLIGVATSDELTPRYLYATAGNSVYQIDLTNGQRATVPLSNAIGEVFAASSSSTAAPAQIQVFGNNQSVRAGTAFRPIVIRVVDASGRPVVNTPVTFTSGDTALTLSNVSAVTTGEGYALAFPSTPTVNGNYGVSIAVGNLTSNVTLAVTGGTTPGGGGGTPGGGGNPTGPGGLFRVSGNGQITYANQPSIFPFVVELRDDQGKPIEKAAVTFTVSSTDPQAGFLIPAAVTGEIYGATCNVETRTCTGVTDARGRTGVGYFSGFLLPAQGFVQYPIVATAGTATNTFTITVLAEGNGVGAQELNPPQGSLLRVPAGGVLKDAIRASLISRGPTGFGPIPNVGISVRTQNTDPTKGVTAQCVGGEALSNAEGVATCDLQVGPMTGTSELTLEFANRQFYYTVQVIQPTPGKINVTQGATLSGRPGAALGQIIATVTDASNNPLVGVPVTWQVSNAAGVVLSGASTTSGANGRISAAVTGGTTPGAYTVTIRAGNVTQTTNVTVTQPVGSLAVLRGGGQSARFNQPFGQALVVRVLDATGSPVVGLPISFSVTSGSATLSASSNTTNSAGEASVTATAGGTAGPVVVTAASGNLTATFNLTVQPPGPSFGLNNLLNGASFEARRRIAPGEILTITGTGIASHISGVVSPTAIVGPLPTTLAGVQVLFNGVAAPIYHVANVNGREQVTVQVPFEVQAGQEATIVMTVQGGSSTLANVPVDAAAPGIFEADFGNGTLQGVVLHRDGSYVSPSNPARRGETLRLYAMGLGQVTPATGTNQAGTGGQVPLGRVFVGVNNAGVDKDPTASYVAGSIGLYLVEFEVPVNAPLGSAIPLAIAVLPAGATDNINSNTTVIPIAQ